MLASLTPEFREVLITTATCRSLPTRKSRKRWRSRAGAGRIAHPPSSDSSVRGAFLAGMVVRFGRSAMQAIPMVMNARSHSIVDAYVERRASAGSLEEEMHRHVFGCAAPARRR